MQRIKKSTFKNTSKQTEARNIPEETKASASVAKESEKSKDPEAVITDIHELAQEDHTKSVAVLIAKDKTIPEK
jgi:hypothetical protein